MTNTASLSARARQLSSAALGQLGGGPTRVLALGAAVVLLIGVVTALTGHLGTALVMVLLVQGALFGLLLLQRRSAADAHASLVQHVDDASARSLSDLSRTRHAILSAIDCRDDPSDRNGPEGR